MNAKEKLAERGVELVSREYGDRLELAADFGPAASVSVDVVDGTVIVVTDEETFDIEVEEDARAFIKNGVLTIELNTESQS